jgi:hypothetical protein
MTNNLPQLPEFEKWLRSVCFQAPPAHAYDLARCAWIEAGRAALAQAQSCVPAGWVLVPEDPTKEMLKKACAVDWSNEDGDAAATNIWQAMLAASPQPQPVQPSEHWIDDEGRIAWANWRIADLEKKLAIAQAKPEQAAQPLPKDLIYMGSLEAGYVDNKTRIAFANGARFAESHHGIAAPQPKD